MAKVTIQATDVISTSRTDINSNFTELYDNKIETSYLDTDTTLAANSDSKIATQKAVKTYVDSGGNVNASTTQKGLVEEATAAEVAAGTGTGATGARLFVNPSLVAETGTDKIVKTKSTGYLDSSIIPVGKIEVDATEVTVGNTSAETTLFDVSVPGGILSTNNAIRLKIFCGDVDVANSATLTIKLKYGATTLATAVNGGGNGASTDYKGWIEAYLIADGSTSAQKGAISYEFTSNEHEIATDATVQIGKVIAHANGTATEDSTASKTLSVTAQWDTNTTTRTITAEFWVVEKIA